MLEMLRVPVALPTLFGSNQSVAELLAPGSIVFGASSEPELKGPDTVTLERVSAAVPVFLMVSVRDADRVT